jgi:class 3 adenylate cyclase/predicted ATPase
VKCFSCGFENPGGAKFCCECGKRLRDDIDTKVSRAKTTEKETVITRRDELRTVTILFADVKGFTAMSDGFQADELKDVMAECFDILEECIKSEGGIVDKYMGDRVMALFGVPISSENDPQRAIRAGLKMQQALRDFSRRFSTPVQMRIGINTGKVLAGLIGKDFADFTVMGQPVNIASRLEESSPPGGILVSASTYRHTSKLFEFNKKSLSIRGLDREVEVYEVLAEKGKPPLPFEDTAVAFMMIARAKELTTLQASFKKVIDQRVPGVIMIIAPQGYGKSRLIYEFTSFVSKRYKDTKIAISSPAGYLPPPYSMLGEIIRECVGVSRDDTNVSLDERLQEVFATSKTTESSVLENVHLIKYLLGMVPPSDPVISAYSDSLEILQRMIFRSVSEFFARVAKDNPLVIIMEDIHLADSGTLEAIAFTAVAVEDAPILIIASSRDDQLDGAKTLTRNLSNFTSINLSPIKGESAKRCVDEFLSPYLSRHEIPDTLRDVIVERSGGNPYYIREIIRDLLDRRVIVQIQDKWVLQEERFSELKVPETLEGLIQSRLDRLPPGEKLLLQEASAQGIDFWESPLSIIEETIELENTKDIVESVEYRLFSLKQKGFITNKQRSRLSNEREFTFLHPFIWEVLYNSIPIRIKRAYHGAILNYLLEKTQGQMEEFYPLIAYQSENSGATEVAKQYYLRSAKVSQRLFDNLKAAEFYKKVLSLAGKEDTRLIKQTKRDLGKLLRLTGGFDEALRFLEESLAAETNARQRLDIYIAICDTLYRKGDFDKALQHYSAAIQEISDISQQESTLWLCTILNGIAAIHYARGENELAISKGADALALMQRLTRARTDREERIFADILNTIGLAYQQKGRYEDALSNFKTALSIYRNLVYLPGIGKLVNNKGMVYFLKGDFATAENCYKEALGIFERIGDIKAAASTLTNIGLVYKNRYLYEDALKYLNRSMRIRERIGDRWGVASSVINLATVYLELGCSDTIVDLFKTAQSKGINLNDRNWLWYESYSLGMANILACKYEVALGFLKGALTLADQMDSSRLRMWSLQGLADAYNEMGNQPEALTQIHRAYKIASAIPDETETLRIKLTEIDIKIGLGENLDKIAEELKKISKNIKKLSDTYLEFMDLRVWGRFYEEASKKDPQHILRMIQYYKLALRNRHRIATNIKDPKLRQSYLSLPEIKKITSTLERYPDFHR